ncbi:T9SS sorting signal type C domain-containing protein [Flavobacterium soli]|uniref:T9SS sorting signal type C domain-containing protein n=1 Tax=Flavobacterium soli TaxID=344881 RepID=UPI00047ADEDF|nr:T9SS sorting signal type C domain-containing protein [Flavobacterium soli]
MKKITFLLFIALLSVFGFGQTKVVTWNGRLISNSPSYKPTFLINSSDSGISSSSLTATDVATGDGNLSIVSWESFYKTGWPNSSSYDSSSNHYFLLTVTAKPNQQLDFSKLVLTYKGNNKKMTVRYSKNSNMSNSTELHYTGLNQYNTPYEVQVNFPSTVSLNSSETLYIRIYGYDNTGQPGNGNASSRYWSLQFDANNPSNTVGPTLYSSASCTASTAPTTITGVNNVCPGSSVTLVASGGTHGTSATYEWGTGTVGSNIIAGQATATLTHTPTVNPTTYWVRRKDAAPCTVATTSAVTKSVTLTTPGDQTTYGNDSWIGYAYTWSGTPAATTYVGYVTESETFDRNLSTGSITGASGTANLCSTPADNFFVRYKMTKNFPTGNYEFTVGGDDGYRLSVDGGATFVINNWNIQAYGTTTVNVCLSGATNLVLEYYENGGDARVSFNYTYSANPAAPTAITGTTTICTGESTTLTANVTGGTYQWGTGTVGSNIIAGQTANAITVSPTVNTTYWVRKVSCPSYTNAATVDVIVGPVGNPGDFGTNAWNVYGYNQATLEPVVANYRGFYTQNTLNINTTTAWDQNASPAAAASTSSNTAYQGCSLPNDNFTFVHKRQGFPAGSYELRMVAWDDNTRVYVNGVQVVEYNGWYGGTPQNNLLGVYCLDAASTIEVRTLEGGGGALLTMNVVPVSAVYNNGWTATATDHSVEIQSSMSLGSNLQVCTCTVKAGQTLTIESNNTLTVIGDVVVEAGGQIIVENNGSFVQVNDNATFTGDDESFLMKRETQPVFRFDFTYYSSPIKEASGFTLKKLSPLTLASKYYSWNETNQGWTVENANTTVMEEGRGYIVRAPQTFDVLGQVGAEAKKDTINFAGLPNNGVINFDNIEGSSTASKWNLIGNPYPSALSIDEFYNNSINSTNLEGTIYLWTHNTPLAANENTGTYTYSPSDYASYNRSGGVGTSALSEEDPDDNVPTGFVAAGQSFFVKGIVDGTSTVTFNNSMRVAGNNNQFFRPGTQEPINNWETTGKHRVWLNLTGGTNAFNQALVGYIEGATDGLDWGFDGDQFGGNQVTLYSLLDTKKLTIQGRALPFNDQDEVPLGYKTTLTGTLKIAIDHFDGLFNGQDIYLEDKMLNIVHNLKEADYTFTTVPGTFNDRFVLRYVPAAELGTDNPTVDANSMVIFRSGSQIDIKSNDQTIEHVTVYDLLGKVIFEKGNINAQSFSTSQLNVSNQVVIVKVITDTQAEVVKKVIMN